MELKGIKNIIFDLGGVIINLDESATYRAFEQLFQPQFEALESRLHQADTLQQFELGKIGPSEFIRFFQTFQSEISEEQIISAWNTMLLDIPIHRVQLIRSLARKYRVFILSNTNSIHLQYINQLIQKEFGFERLSHLVENAYYSHELGLRKPNPAIFRVVLSENNLVAEETLFIDDSEQHLFTAKQLHLKTHHLKPEQDIVSLFYENK